MSVSLSGTLSWKIIPCAGHGRRASIPRHQYDGLRCELTPSVLVGYAPTAGSRAATESPLVYLLVASMGEVRRLNRCAVAIETAPTSGFPRPQNEYVVLTAPSEGDAQLWLDALCDAVELHNREHHHFNSNVNGHLLPQSQPQPQPQPPSHPPHGPHLTLHKYAPEPTEAAASQPHRLTAPPHLSTAAPPPPRHPPSAYRVPLHFKTRRDTIDNDDDEESGEDNREQQHVRPSHVRRAHSWSNVTSSDSSTTDVTVSEDEQYEDSPRQAHQTRWRPNPKPLLKDVVHDGACPSHSVLAPDLGQLVTADLDGSESEASSQAVAPDRRRASEPRDSKGHRHRRRHATTAKSSRAARTVGTHADPEAAQATASPWQRRSDTAKTPSRSRPVVTHISVSPERRVTHNDDGDDNRVSPRRTDGTQQTHARAALSEDDNEERAGSKSEGSRASSLPLSLWRWGPVEPGPAVPAVVAIASDPGSLPHGTRAITSGPEYSAAVQLSSSRRHSLTPLIQYSLPFTRRRQSSLSPDTRIGGPASRLALIPFGSSRREPWAVGEVRESSRGKGQSRRSRHRHNDDDDNARDERDRRHHRDRDRHSSRDRKRDHSRRHDRRHTTSSHSERNPPIDDENVAFLCHPRIFLKYDAQAESGRAPALHYVFLTVDEEYLVAVPAQVFDSAIERAGIGKQSRRSSSSRTRRGDGANAHPEVAVRSLDRALKFFGKNCTAISLRSILRVRRGCDEPMIMGNAANATRFTEKGCVVCVVSNKRAFFLESKSQEEAIQVVSAFESVLAESIP